jgi:hypothetical protein
MGMKAILDGKAGLYRIRGAVWELGSSTFRAYVHLVPAAPYSGLSRAVLSAEGATVQQVLGTATARVRSAVGGPVDSLQVIPGATVTPPPDTSARPVRRFPPPTD